MEVKVLVASKTKLGVCSLVIVPEETEAAELKEDEEINTSAL